jgi:WD40 repeat protein
MISLAVSPDGSRLAAGSSGGKLRLWDTTSGDESWDEPRTIQVASQGLADVQFSPDGATLLTVSESGVYFLYDVETWRQIRTVSVSRAKWQHRVAWLADGRSFLAVDDRQSVVQLAVDGESPTRTWALKDMGALRALVVLPDQQHFVLGAGSLLDRHDFESEDRRRMRRSHTGDIISIRVTPDGKSLLSAGQDQTIRHIDIASESERQRFTADTYCTQVVCISPDGRIIVSGGGWHVEQSLNREGDYRLRVWPVAEVAAVAKQPAE